MAWDLTANKPIPEPIRTKMSDIVWPTLTYDIHSLDNHWATMFSYLAWSSIAQSVCQRAFSLLEIQFQRPSGFESCIQQRKTTCLLSIRKSLACARASKLTTTNIMKSVFSVSCIKALVPCKHHFSFKLSWPNKFHVCIKSISTENAWRYIPHIFFMLTHCLWVDVVIIQTVWYSNLFYRLISGELPAELPQGGWYPRCYNMATGTKPLPEPMLMQISVAIWCH